MKAILIHIPSQVFPQLKSGVEKGYFETKKILRDCTPDSALGGKDTVRALQRCKEVDRNDQPPSIRWSNKTERNSLSGKFRPARMV
jgi:hypothetical protein